MRDRNNHRFRDRIEQDEAKARDVEGASARGLSPSKRYRVDPRYQRVPVALCWNARLGLPTCGDKGEGKYCYCKIPCELQMDINDPEVRIPAAEALFQETQKKLRTHAHKQLTHSDERAIDEFVDAYLKTFPIGGKE